MKDSKKRPTRRSLEQLVRRWKREAIGLRWELAEANLRMLKMQRDWDADRRVFSGALQLLKEHRIRAGSTEVIQAAIRAESPNTQSLPLVEKGVKNGITS